MPSFLTSLYLLGLPFYGSPETFYANVAAPPGRPLSDVSFAKVRYKRLVRSRSVDTRGREDSVGFSEENSPSRFLKNPGSRCFLFPFRVWMRSEGLRREDSAGWGMVLAAAAKTSGCVFWIPAHAAASARSLRNRIRLKAAPTKVNHQPTFRRPRNFTFRSRPIIFIQPNDCSTRLRFCWLIA